MRSNNLSNLTEQDASEMSIVNSVLRCAASPITLLSEDGEIATSAQQCADMYELHGSQPLPPPPPPSPPPETDSRSGPAAMIASLTAACFALLLLAMATVAFRRILSQVPPCCTPLVSSVRAHVSAT